MGSLTYQLFCNVYMNAFDQFAKRQLEVEYYIRYADDFVLLLGDRKKLVSLIPKILEFLRRRLSLILHFQKTYIKNFASAADSLGWVNFFWH